MPTATPPQAKTKSELPDGLRFILNALAPECAMLGGLAFAFGSGVIGLQHGREGIQLGVLGFFFGFSILLAGAVVMADRCPGCKSLWASQDVGREVLSQRNELTGQFVDSQSLRMVSVTITKGIRYWRCAYCDHRWESKTRSEKLHF